MRSATKTFVGLAGIGVLVATAKLGMPLPVAATPVSTPTTATATPTPTPTPEPTSTPVATKPATQPSATKPSTTVSGTSKSGSAIRYKYGVVQVKVTKKSGKITSITYLKKSATDGRSAVFPDLVVAAKAANGSNISNISGATFTVNAFKKALDSALAKF